MSTFDYENIPAGYYDEIFHRRQGIQSKWHHVKFARLRDRLKGCARHLDIGCGPGTFIGTLDGSHPSVGADISSSQINYARKRYGNSQKTFEQIDGNHLPFANDVFDAVTIIELIEHLPHEQNIKLLREAVRVLRPGGRILVSTPNYKGFWPIIEKMLNHFGPVSYEKQHIEHYTHGKLSTLLTDVGLEHVTVEKYMFASPFTAWLGWRTADYIERLEPQWLTSHVGLLLLGCARKSL